MYVYIHYITLHCIALHCIKLHYITLHTYLMSMSQFTARTVPMPVAICTSPHFQSFSLNVCVSDSMPVSLHGHYLTVDSHHVASSLQNHPQAASFSV